MKRKDRRNGGPGREAIKHRTEECKGRRVTEAFLSQFEWLQSEISWKRSGDMKGKDRAARTAPLSTNSQLSANLCHADGCNDVSGSVAGAFVVALRAVR